MIFQRNFFKAIFLTLLLGVTCSGESAYALDLTSIRFGVHPDSERVVVEMTGASDFKAFVMSNPDRVIVDMKEFNWKSGKVPNSSGSLVSDVRYGSVGKGRGRLVLQTIKPVIIKTAFAIPKSGKQPNRLVIDFVAAGVQSSPKNSTLPLPAKIAAAPITQPNKIAKGAGSAVATNEPISPPIPTPVPSRMSGISKPLIIIDPGHGGQDPGALGANGMYEKTIVLAVGLELKKQLEAEGYRVRMTRDHDIFIPLHDRVKFARANKADLFISLHADSIRNSQVTGASVYTLSDKASDKETEKLAERENKSDLIAGIDLSHQEEDVAGILIDLAARDTMNQSRYLANTVLTSFDSTGVKILDGSTRSAGFAVLKAMDIPSILVEMGYLTNMSEVQRLSSAPHRQRIASALRNSVDVYFQKIAKR